ncbi:Gfo/Idh/MocA family protein [Salinispora oceanensis]|uniref:Gfo/Idh/MocA family protein n=1 Tax=Salinispora oceanensis TaxID=1050199 RepID=UPI0006ACAB28|nr:Gfo/Idh/MocA family oxidoreductase [Salinispora oceanensis]
MSERYTGRVLRVGVVGCADIAIRRILPALVELESTELVAVASRDPAKATAVAATFGCAGVGGYQNLIDDPGIDALYIPLPPSMHHEWVGRALRAGKHVLSEKPLAVNYQQTEDLVRLARAHDRVLAENYMFLHQVRNTLSAFVAAATSADSERPAFDQALLEQAMLVEQVRAAAAA